MIQKERQELSIKTTRKMEISKYRKILTFLSSINIFVITDSLNEVKKISSQIASIFKSYMIGIEHSVNIQTGAISRSQLKSMKMITDYGIVNSEYVIKINEI